MQLYPFLNVRTSPQKRSAAFVCFLALWTLWNSWSSDCSAADHPNILLICVDDLKPKLSCFGDAIGKTPHLDRLAQRGVLFERAYCNQAVCSPSRNALLTSLRPQSIGIYDLPTNFRKAAPDAVTLGQFFQKQGYKTEALGKIFHVGHGNTDDAASWSVPHFRPKVSNYALSESTLDSKTGKNGPKGAAYESADVADDKYADGLVANEAIQRLRDAKAKPDQPFFIAVGFVKPHLPFVAPKKYWDLYDPATIPLESVQVPPEGAPEYAPQQGGELRGYKDIPAQGTLPPDLQRTLIHGYYAAMSYMDAQAGLVLDELKSLDLEKNTIVVLWGDHGWHLGDHGIWCKHTNYEQAARIPLIIAAPQGAKNAKSKSFVETVDIYPTLAELAGLPAPSKIDGKSFASVVQTPSQSTRQHITHVFPRNVAGKGQILGRAIRTEQYRLVEWKAPGADSGSAEYELYDYAADPLETKNLANDNPKAVADLKAILATYPEAKPQWKDPKGEAASGNAANGKPKQDRNAMFDRRDKNQDGRLTREEFLANQPDPDQAPERFTRFDKNQDGVLSRDEFVRSGK